MGLKGKLIQVIDDDEDLRKLIRKVLENAGCIVIEATSVKEALYQLSTHSPDLFLLDVNMPEYTGIHFLQFRLKSEKLKMVPALILSAVKDKQTVADAIALGASFYLKKPLESVTLLQRLRQIFRDEEPLKATFAFGALKADLIFKSSISRMSPTQIEIGSPVKFDTNEFFEMDIPSLKSLGLQKVLVQVPLQVTVALNNLYIQRMDFKNTTVEKINSLRLWIRENARTQK